MLKSITFFVQQILPRQKKYRIVLLVFGLLLVVQMVFVLARDVRATVVFRDETIRGSADEQYELIRSQASSYVLQHGDKEVMRSIEELGASLDDNDLKTQLDQASSWHYFIPVWGAVRLFDSVEVTPMYSMEEETLQTASVELAVTLSYQPIDATIQNTEGSVWIEPEQSGSVLSEDVVFRTLQAHFTQPKNSSISFVGQELIADINTDDLQPVVDTYGELLAKDVEVRIDEKSFNLTASDILGLIDIDQTDLRLSETGLAELIAEWSSEVSKTPGVTELSYVDDIEVGRTAGEDGVTLDVETTVVAIQSWFDNPSDDAIIELQTTTVPAQVIEQREYTATNAGLRSLIENWDKNNSGSYYVAVQELSGQARQASLSADNSVVMASTYKVFLAAAAYTLAQNNELSLSTVVYNGNTIEKCIELGLIYSDNACIVAAGWHIGWDKIDTTLASMGFGNTRLNNYNADKSFNGDKLSTAREQIKLLQRLAQGTLLNQTNTQKLRGYMAQDIYTDGIPAGSRGSAVEHKVGFLSAYKHDMGIVYGAGSTYALVILSNNASWSQIADLSGEIYDFLN